MITPEERARRTPVRRKALEYLARREHYRGELQEKLEQRGFEPGLIAQVLDDLQGEGILDDRRYLEQFVASSMGRGQGPDRIIRKLRTLGFRIESVGPLLGNGLDWIAAAREVRRRKFGAALPTVHAEILVQAQFLRYRGFTVAQIRAALDSVQISERSSEEGDPC